MPPSPEDREVAAILGAEDDEEDDDRPRPPACARLTATVVEAPRNGMGPIFVAEVVQSRRRRCRRRVPPGDKSFHARMRDDLAMAYFCFMQKQLYHACTRKVEGRPLALPIGVCPHVNASHVFTNICSRFGVGIEDDAHERRSQVTYSVTLTSVAHVEEFCSFHLRWDNARANLRFTRGGCLTIVPPPIIIQWVRSRVSRPYVSNLRVLATFFRVQPHHLQLSSGTDLATTDALEYAVESRAKAVIREWAAMLPEAVHGRWVAWAK
mmetsp:Transcript_15204/g.38060  ORF Transcript_15204/g.38060 Transcript_15204/m.38060 type:complete len:266 (+) Transcript_15204:353-1150(+)